MTYLYIAHNPSTHELYIGIGDSMTRLWEEHNPDADRLLGSPETSLWQTPTPFSSREDARRAEAIAIWAAALAGHTVHSDHDDADAITAAVTNRSGIHSTGHLVPAVERKPGTVHYTDLAGTAIVVISPDAIDTRPAMHGGRSVSQVLDRVCAYWPLDKTRRDRYPLTRMLAITKKEHRIIADLDLDPQNPVTADTFVPVQPVDIDPRGAVGKQLDMNGERLSTRVTFSSDIRARI